VPLLIGEHREVLHRLHISPTVSASRVRGM
jgi:hypothetical protein